jgi:hypothetical protein
MANDMVAGKEWYQCFEVFFRFCIVGKEEALRDENDKFLSALQVAGRGREIHQVHG